MNKDQREERLFQEQVKEHKRQAHPEQQAVKIMSLIEIRQKIRENEKHLDELKDKELIGVESIVREQIRILKQKQIDWFTQAHKEARL